MPDSEEEDPNGGSNCGHMGARATKVDQCDRGIRQAQRPPDAKADHETTAEKFFEVLDLSGLESWPPTLVNSAWSLLAEYLNFF